MLTNWLRYAGGLLVSDYRLVSAIECELGYAEDIGAIQVHVLYSVVY